MLTSFGRWTMWVLVLSCAWGCAFSVPLVPGAEQVQVERSAPNAGAMRLKELRAVHGSGCGFLGGLGSYDGALSTLRNLAKEAGADYVQITATQEPYSDGQCRHNEYVIQGVAYRVAGTLNMAPEKASAGVVASKAESEIVSSCEGDRPASQGGEVRLSGTSCSYLLRSMPEGVDYEVTFGARLPRGGAFAIWPDGSWQAGQVRGTAVVVDQARGGLSWVRYVGKEQTLVSTVPWAVDGEWHEWRVARNRGRMVLWLDSKLMLIVLGEPVGPQIGLRTLGGSLEIRNFLVKPLSRPETLALNGLGMNGWRVAVVSAPSTTPAPAEPVRQDLTWKELAALLPRQVGEWRQREAGAVVPLPTVTSSYSKIEGGKAVIVNILVERGKGGSSKFEANDRIDGLPAAVTSDADSTLVRISDDVVIEINSHAVDTKEFAAALGVRRIGSGVEAVLARQAKGASKPAPRTSAKPSRLVGNCNLDEIDWENRSYPGSKVSKQRPITLVKGAHRLTSRKVKPDPLMTLGQSEQGTELRFSGAYPIELDGQAPPEVKVNIRLTDFGVWHGNSVPAPDPSTEYVFRLGEGCEPTLLGFVDLHPDDTTRAENNAFVRISGYGSKLTLEEWRVQDGKFQRAASRSVGREALEEPLPPCDEATSMSRLASYEGRKGWEVLREDSCILRRLQARVGSQREQFEVHTSMGLGPFERRGDYLVSAGCQVHVCGFNQAALSIHRETGVVEAVIFDLTPQATVGALKWFTVSGKPLPALKESVDEGVERLR